jgi:hypothetical protein
MKKLLSLRFCSMIVTTLMVTQITAQDTSYRIIASYNEERPLPKYLLRFEAANYPEISAMALLAFKRDFSTVKDVSWSIVENKYMARFTSDGRKTRVLFDKKGQIVYSVSEGTLRNLPADTRKTVRSIYYDYDITKATEVHTLDKSAWIINLEDETSLVIVRVMDGEVTETGNYRKSR